MIKMYLESTLAGCPLSWQNFILWLQKESNNFAQDVAMNIIQQELKKFNAEYNYVCHNKKAFQPDYVSFNTEQDYIWFTLRWA